MEARRRKEEDRVDRQKESCFGVGKNDVGELQQTATTATFDMQKRLAEYVKMFNLNKRNKKKEEFLNKFLTYYLYVP